MDICYGVKWIEVEFGQRDEGYKLFTSLENAKKVSEEDVRSGHYSGGYIGPEKPLTIYEIPIDCLPEKEKKEIRGANMLSWTWIDNHWEPKFKAPIK